jgi:hypothetical protein
VTGVARAQRLRRVASCLGAALCVAASATATPRTFDSDGLRIIIDADWATQLGPGYVPLRVDVTNVTDARTLTVSEQSLRYPTYRGIARYQPSRLVAERTITLARGARVQFTMSIPVSVDSENMQLTFRENGKLLQSIGLGGIRSGLDAEHAAVLIVTPKPSTPGAAAPEWAKPSRTMATSPGVRLRPGTTMPTIDVAMEPTRLPTSWLGYSSLRAVMIGASEWTQLTEDQRTALRKWTACGGDLIVIDGDAGSFFAPGLALASGDGSRSTSPYLLGHLHRVPSEEIAAAGLDSLLAALPAVRNASWRLPVNRAADWKTKGEKGFRLRMPGVGEVHARGYLTLLMLFAVLIGPVNYLYLRRRGLQPLIVLTTPLIAVAFLALLGVYVVTAEGFGVHVRAATLTVLDQDRQEAVTRADVSLYPAGHTPGGGLHFSSETAVLAFDAEERPEVHLDLTDGQRFDDGFVRARTPVNFETIEWRPARERLTFVRDGRALTVTNGLGATVNQLFVRSASGTFELASPIASGGQATLHAWVKTPILMPAYHPLYPRYYEVLATQPPNSYVALVDKAPSWDPGLANAIEHDSTHVVLGLLGRLP